MDSFSVQGSNQFLLNSIISDNKNYINLENKSSIQNNNIKNIDSNK